LEEVSYYFEIKKEEGNKHLQWYYFLGQIIGKALFDFVPVHFPVCKPLLKLMMNRDYKFGLEDMKQFDTQMYNSLKMISESTLTPQEIDSLQINFFVELYD